MNHHAPPGGWEPPEPSWMRELREIDASISRHATIVTRQVNRYARLVKYSSLGFAIISALLVAVTLWARWRFPIPPQ